MKSYQSLPLDIKAPIIGRVTKNAAVLRKGDFILISDLMDPCVQGFRVVLTWNQKPQNRNTPKNIFYNIHKPWLDSLNDGDIIEIQPNGLIKVQWEVQSNHNVIMITNKCNCHCLMCPQPSCDDPKDLFSNSLKILQLIKKDSIQSIVLTGGEPTIYLDRCIQILKICSHRFPNIDIALLTNGSLLSVDNIRKLLSINHRNLTFCIPIHGDNSEIHDFITNNSGSFIDTITSIQNLATFKQKIQLRVVITKYNYQRLQSISEFIFRNFPFVVHVAFMGMEVCGLAYDNKDKVWVDPFYFKEELCGAVKHLYQRNIKVSIYNLPLCLLPNKYWGFAADSISDWKKGYAITCNECKVKTICPGIFTTSLLQSKYIKPICTID